MTDEPHGTSPSPVSKKLSQAIEAGSDAASFSILELGGEVGSVQSIGDDATATVRFRLDGDTEPRVRVLPLTYILRIAAERATIEEVSAPDLDSWMWTAEAMVVIEDELPGGPDVPTVRQRRLLKLVASDDRGLSAALHSRDTWLAHRGRLGDALAALVSSTTIPGAAQRLRRARDHIAGEFGSVLAGAVAEHLMTPSATAGLDGGPPLIEFEITVFDEPSQSWISLVSFPAQKPDPDPTRRRAALSHAALKAIEEEAFGVGANSPRSKLTVIGLDTPAPGAADGSSTAADSLVSDSDTANTVERRFELTELVGRAGLSPRELEVLDLRLQGHREAEIGAILGLSRGAVSSNWTRARKKIREARDDTPENV